jgi:DNA-binding CsgD family transcriptional regulator
MAGRPGVQGAMASIVDVCHRGYPPERLKAEVMLRLQRVVPVDALWWATSDPATVLFTQAYREGIPDRLIPAFVDNEFLGKDVNRWIELARDPVGVRTMAGATSGELGASARFRDLLQPIGLGDELRAVLRTGDSCWGLMCLHRELGRTFTNADQQVVRRLAPHLAEGLRAGLLMAGAVRKPYADAPGLVVLEPSGELVSATAAASAWFAELGAPGDGARVPAEVRTAAALLTPPNATSGEPRLPVPRLRCRTRAGRWVVLHASWLEQSRAGSHQVAVIIEPAAPDEVATVIMAAYGLTERERAVTGLVCQGQSTAQIATELRISTNTVQDHLKSVFDKTGVRSRGEVMARILHDHYLPALHRGLPVGPSGFFDSSGATGSPGTGSRRY